MCLFLEWGSELYARWIELLLPHLNLTWDFWIGPSYVQKCQIHIASSTTLYYASQEGRERVIKFLLDHEIKPTPSWNMYPVLDLISKASPTQL